MSEPVVEFENTSNKTEHTRFYAITNSPIVQDRKGQPLKPIIVKFVFRDGESVELAVTARLMKKDGSDSERVQQMTGIYTWAMQDWPAWLHVVHKLAHEEYKEDLKASAFWRDLVTQPWTGESEGPASS